MRDFLNGVSAKLRRAHSAKRIRRAYKCRHTVANRLKATNILICLLLVGGVMGLFSPGLKRNGICCLLCALWLYGYRLATALSKETRKLYLQRTWILFCRGLVTLFVLGLVVTVVAVLLVEYPNPFVRQIPGIGELSARWIAWLNEQLAKLLYVS